MKTKEDKAAIGDRINYNVRKSITQSFKSENITNKLFNPAFVVPALLLSAANMGTIADFACKALAAFKDGATALFTKTAKAVAGAR